MKKSKYKTSFKLGSSCGLYNILIVCLVFTARYGLMRSSTLFYGPLCSGEHFHHQQALTGQTRLNPNTWHDAISTSTITNMMHCCVVFPVPQSMGCAVWLTVLYHCPLDLQLKGAQDRQAAITKTGKIAYRTSPNCTTPVNGNEAFKEDKKQLNIYLIVSNN